VYISNLLTLSTEFSTKWGRRPGKKEKQIIQRGNSGKNQEFLTCSTDISTSCLKIKRTACVKFGVFTKFAGKCFKRLWNPLNVEAVNKQRAIYRRHP